MDSYENRTYRTYGFWGLGYGTVLTRLTTGHGKSQAETAGAELGYQVGYEYGICADLMRV